MLSQKLKLVLLLSGTSEYWRLWYSAIWCVTRGQGAFCYPVHVQNFHCASPMATHNAAGFGSKINRVTGIKSQGWITFEAASLRSSPENRKSNTLPKFESPFLGGETGGVAVTLIWQHHGETREEAYACMQKSLPGQRHAVSQKANPSLKGWE